MPQNAEPRRRRQHGAPPQYVIRQARTRQVDYVPPKDARPVNLKEPRFSVADGECRVAFAFYTKREVMPMVAGNKSGSSEKRSYRGLVRKADERFAVHLARLKFRGK